MGFTIKKDEFDYSIDFKFSKQLANIRISVMPNNRMAHVCFNTDGYHWSAFWLAQEPNCKNLIYDELEGGFLTRLDKTRLAEEKTRAMFLAHGYKYTPEDRESFFIDAMQEIDEAVVRDLASIIEPRLANRERFF